MYKVLIADNDGASCAGLVQVLSKDDCQIEVVSQGEDLLKHVAGKEIDVLIVEVQLPDMPIWDIIPQVRQIDNDIPIISISEDNTLETSKRVRIEGGPVFFYGIKPLDLGEMQLVVKCAAKWRQKHK